MDRHSLFSCNDSHHITYLPTWDGEEVSIIIDLVLQGERGGKAGGDRRGGEERGRGGGDMRGEGRGGEERETRSVPGLSHTHQLTPARLTFWYHLTIASRELWTLDSPTMMYFPERVWSIM